MATTCYFWDGDNLLQEYDQLGATVAHYVTEPEQYGPLVSQHRSGQTHVYHYDGLGSTTELTNGAGSVSDMLRYSAFGHTVDEVGGNFVPFQFVGRLGYHFEEEQQTCYVRRRQYIPQLGRWASADRFGVTANDSNVYGYARNSPVVFIDPSGDEVLNVLACATCVGLICAISQELAIKGIIYVQCHIHCSGNANVLLYNPCMRRCLLMNGIPKNAQLGVLTYLLAIPACAACIGLAFVPGG